MEFIRAHRPIHYYFCLNWSVYEKCISLFSQNIYTAWSEESVSQLTLMELILAKLAKFAKIYSQKIWKYPFKKINSRKISNIWSKRYTNSTNNESQRFKFAKISFVKINSLKCLLHEKWLTDFFSEIESPWAPLSEEKPHLKKMSGSRFISPRSCVFWSF